MTSVSDDLNRADDPTGLGAGWLIRSGAMGLASGMAYPVGTAQWAYATPPMAMASNDAEVSVTLGPADGAIDHFLLFVGANTTGECVFAYFYQGNAYFWHQYSWSSYFNIQGASYLPQAPGDTITLRRNGTVHTILKNGVDTGIHIDYPSIPIDTNHLLLGFGLYSESQPRYRTIDAFSAKDTAVSPALSGGGTLSATVEVVTPPSGFAPTDLSGCTVWLDATQLSSLTTQWPDLSGNDNHGAVVGTPAPTIVNNSPYGLPVVRFKANEGRVRGSGMYPAATPNSSFTVMFVGRQWGPTIGRIFSNPYPPFNFLVGTHASGRNSCFDAGWINSGTGWTTPPTPWTTWGFVYHGSPNLGTFFVDGVDSGSSAGGGGHDDRWNLSGYSDTGGEESCDVEVAELVIYDRDLTTTERQQVEEYLHDKWFEEGGGPEPIPVAAAFNGGGSLSATVTASYPTSASLTGGGSLSATVHKWASPADTPGLGLWLDASALTGLSNGDNVTAWPDSSVAARHATAVDGNKPLYRPIGLNGHPAVDFSGASRRVSIPGLGTALTGKTQYTMFYVAQVATFGYSVVATAPTNTIWRWLLEYEPSGGFYWGHSNGNFWQFTPILASNVPHRLTFHHTPSGPHFYVNGTEHTSYYTNGAGLGPTVDNVDGDVYLGAYYEGSYPVDGVIAEFIFYDHALTTAERLQVEDYLNQKYFGGVPSTPVSVGFSGSGSLSAVVAPRLPVTVDLIGAGALSATRMPLFSKTAALAGAGALTETHKQVYSVPGLLAGGGSLTASAVKVVPGTAAPTLEGEGTLSAQTKQIQAVTAALYGDGSLMAFVPIPSVDYSSGGWTVSPPTPVPVSRQGWTTTATTVSEDPKQGWIGAGVSVKVTARPTGAGLLTAALMARPFKAALLAGNGALSTALLQREFPAMGLSGDGALSGTLTKVEYLFPQFSGTGFVFGDTVSTHLEPEFSGSGELRGNIDGLTAAVYPVYLLDALFGGVGTLIGDYDEIHRVNMSFAGAGALTGPLVPKLIANLAASGALSASVLAGYFRTASLLGSGTLSGTDFARYLRSIGFAGPGNLAGLLQPLFTPPGGGEGTISALVSQIYSPTLALSGGGTLSASPIASYQQAASLSGGGALAATATKVPIPAITSITTAPFHVGDTVTVTGTGFSGTTGVTVGGVAVTEGNFVNDTTMTIVIPSVALGARDVVVSAASGVSAPYSITLVVFPATITTVSPSTGHRETAVTITGTNFIGVTSVTIGGQAVSNLSVVNTTTITCNSPGLANGTYDVVVATSGNGTATKTSAFTYSFTPTTETNLVKTNVARPAGTSGCWVTLIGGGGSGGTGHGGAFQNCGGGGGGGGGGCISRSFIPVASLGSTYSVVIGAKGVGANGTASSFSSGSGSASANGGTKGGNGGSAVAGTAGAGGTTTISGFTGLTALNGGAGGAGTLSSAGVAGANQTTTAPGGGGGAGRGGAGQTYAGGKGGNSATAAGGTASGGNGAAAAAGNPGGGGAGGVSTNGTGGSAGDAGVYGAGGGGGGGGNSTGPAGDGSAGSTIVEWV